MGIGEKGKKRKDDERKGKRKEWRIYDAKKMREARRRYSKRLMM